MKHLDSHWLTIQRSCDFDGWIWPEFNTRKLDRRIYPKICKLIFEWTLIESIHFGSTSNPWTKVYLVSESEHWQIISSLTGLNESKKCFWAYNGNMIGYLEKYHWKKLFTWKHFLGLELKKDRMKKSLKLRINGHIDSTFIKQKNCTVMMETSFHFVCLSAKG